MTYDRSSCSLDNLGAFNFPFYCRSPGGTPIRDRAKSPVGGDPAAIIAAALKKRFAKMHVDSPEKEADERNDFDSSPESTPKTSRRIILPKQNSNLAKSDKPVRNLLPILKKPTPRFPKEENSPKPESPVHNLLPVLKKSTPRTPKPLPKEEQNNLPIVSVFFIIFIFSNFLELCSACNVTLPVPHNLLLCFTVACILAFTFRSLNSYPAFDLISLFP